MGNNHNPDKPLEIVIPIGTMIGEVERKAMQTAQEQLTIHAQRFIANMFYVGHPYRGNDGTIKQDKGVLMQLLSEKIADYVLSREFEEKIQASIERHMDPEADAAVKAMLNSASRKRVFSAVPHE